jgi:hypothetical protein
MYILLLSHLLCLYLDKYLRKFQVDLVHKRAKRSLDVYKSSYIYVNGCFFNDTRDKDNIDLSRVVRDWVTRGKR